MARRTRKTSPPANPVPAPAAAPAPPSRAGWDALAAAVLAILCLAVFAQTATFGFINFDDGQFVFENPAVRAGLTAQSVTWAAKSTEIGYYPLTWLSHMLDVELWGLKGGGHHATAVLLHFLSSLLLYLTFRRVTGAPLPSALVAALFAIHPMHVESVAWISERKDTLSTLFGMLALLIYVSGRPTIWRYAGVALALVASLLSKQMLVTLPFALLLLDYWPLRRIDAGLRGAGRAIAGKLPLFAIVAAGAVVAVIGQRNLNAIQASTTIPLGDRIATAFLAYASYLGKLFWPSRLAPIYPLETPNYAAAFAAFALLCGITAAAWFLRKTAPYFIVGWLWFLGTLVPVIGIVQIGSQSMADRYTYFPYIGLFVAIAFAAADHLPQRALAAAGSAAVVILAVVAFHQTTYWKTTDALFTHTLEVTGPNPLAEYTLGQSLELTDPDRSILHLRRALKLSETAFGGKGAATESAIYAQSHTGLGTALIMKARSTTDPSEMKKLLDEATSELTTAIRLDPSAETAKRNLALIQAMRPKPAPTPPPAVAREAEIDQLIDAGLADLQHGRRDQAIAEFQKAVSIAPASIEARVYLGLALAKIGRAHEAAVQLREAKRIDPARANRFVTGALRRPPGDDNLDLLLLQLER